MSQETSNSPAPLIAAPSPLQIGKAFIKQYYQVLSTNPLQIQKFYKPDSVISHSLLPSVPTNPQTFSEMSKSVVAAGTAAAASDEEGPSATTGGGMIFQWCKAVDENHKVCFDFGRGAIDAQETVNGGILLVVTGHMRLPQQDLSNDDGMKRFVHTFFLNNSAPAGKKRQFYVHNDVLRFLDEGVVGASSFVSEEEGDKASEVHGTENAVKDQESKVEAKKGVDDDDVTKHGEDKDTETDKDTAEITVVKPEEGVVEDNAIAGESMKAPSTAADLSDVMEHGGVKIDETQAENEEKENEITEETKDESDKKRDIYNSTMSEDSSEKVVKPDGKKDKAAGTSQEKKSRKNKSRGRSRKSRSSSPTDGIKASKGKKSGVAGSWASLVAGGSGPSAVAAAAADVASGLFKEDKDVSSGKDGHEQKIESSKKSSVGVSEKQKKTYDVVMAQQQPQIPSKKAAAAQRTPEATILIKNISEKVKESEIRALFEPYASKLQKKILSITLLSNRGFCFVDFDSKDVVDEVIKVVEMEKDAKAESQRSGKDGASSKFIADGRELEIGRKTPGEKAGFGGRGRGFRRSSSPNRGGGYNKSSRGVGRKNSPRGANRSATKK